ncbi:hypothetical protein GCM10009113_11420 [Marinobacter szutsaonensis]
MDIETEPGDIILPGHVIGLIIVFDYVTQCEDSYGCIPQQLVGKCTSLFGNADILNSKY